MIEKSGLIILAAGNSTRMGTCKFMLKLDDQTTFLDSILRGAITTGIETILLVVNEATYSYALNICKKHNHSNINIVINNFADKERLYSLQTALKSVPNLNHYFLHNADNPFLFPETIKKLLENRNKAEVIIPVVGHKGGHPVLFNHKVADSLLNAKLHLKINEVLNQHTSLRLPVDNHEVLTDIDNAAEYYSLISQKNKVA